MSAPCLAVPADEPPAAGSRCIEDCGNVVKHAEGAEKFEVHLDVAGDHCAIDVVDNGAGFEPPAPAAPGAGDAPDPEHERGRGLFLIRALSDSVRMDASPRQGCLIHFEKRLPLSSSPEAAACLPEIVNG